MHQMLKVAYRSFRQAAFGWIVVGGAVVLSLLALLFIWQNLRAVEVNRAKMHRALALAVGEPAMRYVLRHDDFNERKHSIILATAAIVSLLAVVLGLLFFLTRLHQRLRAAERTKSEMLSIITHDAKHYLTILKGRVDLLAMKKKLGVPLDHLDKDLAMMSENAVSLERLIEQLHHDAGLSRGRLKLYPQSVDLVEMVQKNLAYCRETARQLNLSVKFEPYQPVVLAWADPQLVDQIVLNLVHNAVKFTRSGGLVEVWLRREQDDLVLGVRDQGPGLRPEERESIFEPFTRLHANVRGTGLGLANARRFARLLGGEVCVRESRIGEGTTFCWTHPAPSRERGPEKEEER